MYPTKKLWEVCEILDNKRIPISSKEREKRIANKGILYPYYWATQQNWFIDDYIFDEELVLLWEDGVDFLNPKKTKAYLISGKTWVNNHAHVLKWLDGILNNTFLLHFLNIFDYFWIVSGTTRLKLNQSAMKNIPIPLPPLSTQKLIVEKLDAIFSEIEKSKNLLEKNLKNVDEMNKSVLEKIFANEEWERKKLREVCEIKKWKKVNYSEQWKYNYIDIGILRTNIIEQYTNDEWVFCDKNDILIAWDGSKSGTVGFWLEWVIGSTLAKITIDTKIFSSKFVWKFLQGNFEYLNKNTSGAAIPHLRKDILINLEIPLPPLETQKNIVSYLDNIFAENQKLKNLYQAQIKNLDEMKQSFLKKAFAGELV